MFVGATGLGHGVGLVVGLLTDILAEGFVVDLVAVFALDGLACHLGQLELGLALLLDGCVGGLEGFEEVGLGDFVHLAFYHHDVFGGGAYHQLHVGSFKLLEGGVDDKLAVDAGHAHLRDRAVEGDVAHGDGGRCGQAGERVGHVVAVGREHDYLHEGVGMVVIGEKRTQHAVDQTGGEHLVV